MALTNSQHDELMRHYDALQLKRLREQTRRREEVYGKSPEFARLDGEFATVCVDAFESSLDVSSSASFAARLATIKARKAEILSMLGYPQDYLTPPCECSMCQDTGYIGSEQCGCFKQLANELLYKQAGQLPSDASFENFLLEYYPDEASGSEHLSPRALAKKARERSEEFVKNFGQKPHRNIIFSGETGTGKTFLSCCIAKELLDRGFSVIYLTAAHMFDIAERITFGHDESGRGEYDRLFSCDLLVIDDLGTEFGNRFTSTRFFNIIEQRLSSGLGTIISTNLSLADMTEQYSERVTSRIGSSYALCKLTGRDIRIEKRIRK